MFVAEAANYASQGGVDPTTFEERIRSIRDSYSNEYRKAWCLSSFEKLIVESIKMSEYIDTSECISALAKIVLYEGLSENFREKAIAIATDFDQEDFPDLRFLLDNPPREPKLFNTHEHGLGGWISSCQFSVFELLFNIGETLLPSVREIAWGPYDWPQGNAIELMIRWAAKGIQRQTIVNEIKLNFPDIRYEAQLYAIEPLISLIKTDQDLKAIIAELSECAAFKQAYTEVVAQ